MYVYVNSFKNSSPGSRRIRVDAQSFSTGISWPLTSPTCTPRACSRCTGSAVLRPLLEARASVARCLGTRTCTWGEERPFQKAFGPSTHLPHPHSPPELRMCSAVVCQRHTNFLEFNNTHLARNIKGRNGLNGVGWVCLHRTMTSSDTPPKKLHSTPKYTRRDMKTYVHTQAHT